MFIQNSLMNITRAIKYNKDVSIYAQQIIMSHVLVTKTGLGLVIGFINHVQLVTNNYYTVPDLTQFTIIPL
jgi:hypothetical protein